MNESILLWAIALMLSQAFDDWRSEAFGLALMAYAAFAVYRVFTP